MTDNSIVVPVVATKGLIYGDTWREVGDAFPMDEENAVRIGAKGHVSLDPSKLSPRGADYHRMLNHASPAYRQTANYRHFAG